MCGLEGSQILNIHGHMLWSAQYFTQLLQIMKQLLQALRTVNEAVTDDMPIINHTNTNQPLRGEDKTLLGVHQGRVSLQLYTEWS